MASGAHALKTAKRGAAAVVLLSTKTDFKNSKGGPAPSVETIENIAPKFGGASRDRTDDLIVANDALSQLSYSPT